MMVSAVVPGILAGNGIEVRCRVSFPIDTAVSNPPMVYSHCTVIQTGERLPDGIYELMFLDQNAFVRLQDGVWSVGKPWLNDDTGDQWCAKRHGLLPFA